MWAVWIVAAAMTAVGLRSYRVDNSLADWLPGAASVGPFGSYCVVGWSTAEVDTVAVGACLREIPSVALCVDPGAVASFGSSRGVTAENFVVSSDGGWAGAFCFPKPGVSDAAFVADVRRAIDRVAAGRALVAGPAVFHVELNAWSQQRLPMIVAAITIGGAVLLAWVTGRARAAIGATTGLVLSQLVLVGGIGCLGIPMDMSLSVVPPMMLALGFSYAAHRAVQPGIIRTLALCGATTAAGFACFAATDLPPIRRFAIVGVAGVALAWLAIMTLVPPPSCTLPRQGQWGRRLRLATIHAACGHPRKVFALFSILSIAAIPLALRIRFESDALAYFPADSPVARSFRTLDERLTGMLPFQVMVDGPCDVAPMLDRTPGVRKVIDVSEFVGGNECVYWCLADNGSTPALEAAEPQWREFADARGCSLAWTGVAAQLAGVSRVVGRIAMLSLPGMVLLAAAVVGLLARSVRLAMLSAWVNAMPALFLLGLAGLTRWPLGLPALMIGAIAIGMAIDDTIHVTWGLARGWSMRRALLRCWRPCAGSTFVAATCVSLFALAPFRPTAEFGILLAAASIAALAGDLLALPAACELHSIANRRSGDCYFKSV